MTGKEHIPQATPQATPQVGKLGLRMTTHGEACHD